MRGRRYSHDVLGFPWAIDIIVKKRGLQIRLVAGIVYFLLKNPSSRWSKTELRRSNPPTLERHEEQTTNKSICCLPCNRQSQGPSDPICHAAAKTPSRDYTFPDIAARGQKITGVSGFCSDFARLPKAAKASSCSSAVATAASGLMSLRFFSS